MCVPFGHSSQWPPLLLTLNHTSRPSGGRPALQTPHLLGGESTAARAWAEPWSVQSPLPPSAAEETPERGPHLEALLLKGPPPSALGCQVSRVPWCLPDPRTVLRACTQIKIKTVQDAAAHLGPPAPPAPKRRPIFVAPHVCLSRELQAPVLTWVLLILKTFPPLKKANP